ncbi:MAG: anaerobic sulfatase maturase [Planctomycetota bacterium]|nr:anaerobic sulfatase maturase [Planctomycetota bacterium]
MHPFSLLIKPACADCNLHCAYCFYLDRREMFPAPGPHRMSQAVLEATIRSYLALPLPEHSFAWQGGEPTLMGVEFFRRAVGLQKQYARPGARVSNGLQTNATLIDDEFAELLGRGKFLVGVSLDGPPDLHDRYRRTAGGKGSHAEVLRGIEALGRHGVEFNILTLVSDANVRRPREVYRYLRDSGFLYHQYIPCVEFDPAGGLLPFSVTGEAWGEFLCELFDEWHAADTRRVSIRLFDAVLMYMVEGFRPACTMAPDCRQYFVVEHDGGIYPCDFFVRPELLLGNVVGGDWSALWESEAYRAFGARKGLLHPACGPCAFRTWCAGGCPKERLARGDGARPLSVLCAGWKQFYAHTLDRFRALARQIVAERQGGLDPRRTMR